MKQKLKKVGGNWTLTSELSHKAKVYGMEQLYKVNETNLKKFIKKE